MMIFGCKKRIQIACADGFIEGLSFQYGAGKKKLVEKLLTPLFPQICRADHEQVAPSLSPMLGEQDPSFDGFAKSDFVGKDGTLR
jgi:hypothetical protein